MVAPPEVYPTCAAWLSTPVCTVWNISNIRVVTVGFGCATSGATSGSSDLSKYPEEVLVLPNSSVPIAG